MLNVTNLSCTIDRGHVRQPLFSGLTFAAGPSEILQVTGKNGAGKTTLLRTLLGLHRDYVGEITWSLERGPLYLGHARALKGRLTALENLHWLCCLHGQPSGTDTIKAALDRAGLGHQADEPCDNLSQGEQKRVCLARLFIQQADCWLLDEPMSALDVAGVKLLNETLANHVGSGGLLIITSHQPLAVGSRQIELEPA